ncbi:MAG TPA: NAD(P)H-binding protein [Mycobacteriales bacterium]
MKVAVAGGTGLTGRHLAHSLTAAGHEPVLLARSRGVDLVTGEGLAGALAGVDAVVDVSNVTTTRREVSERFFTAATAHLRDAAADAGVGHHVVLSIVGLDRVDLPYYAGKRRQEQLLAAGTVPWTVLRTTQFHEFAAQLLARTSGPVALVPAMPSRPVSVAEVAEALVEAVLAGPLDGYATELAGPEVLRLDDMARQVLRRHGDRRGDRHGDRHGGRRWGRRWVLPVRLPGRVGRQLRSGGALPDGEFREGKRTFADYLATIEP